jgi:hypothetical protein
MHARRLRRGSTSTLATVTRTSMHVALVSVAVADMQDRVAAVAAVAAVA